MVLVLHITRQSVVVIGKSLWGQTEKDFFRSLRAKIFRTFTKKFTNARKVLATKSPPAPRITTRGKKRVKPLTPALVFVALAFILVLDLKISEGAGDNASRATQFVYLP
jgi:hypothetical protein